MHTRITIDDRALRRAIDDLGRVAQDGTEPLRQFDAEWKAVVLQEASKIRASGGTFRGQTWAPMKVQYTRRTDGVTVPAWGGVAKVRGGSRTVQGRRRPSGQRVRPTSIVNRDTGALYNALCASRPLILQRRTLIIGGDLPIYAGEVLAANHRNPIFFAPGDQARLEARVRVWLDSLAQRFNR